MSLSPYIARINAILGKTPAEDYTYQELMAIDDTRGLYDDVYVVHYDLEEIGETVSNRGRGRATDNHRTRTGD
jgi:hypothetical protein